MTDELDRMARAYRGYEEANAADLRWSLSNRGNRAALEERVAVTRRLLTTSGRPPLGAQKVLEVGCGAGGELARLVELGADPHSVVGVDLIADRVAAGRGRFPDLDLRVANAERLDFEDAGFDLVMAITLFSSIMDSTMAGNVAAEILRVMRPGGALLWYDFRFDNPRNSNVHGMNAGAIRALFPRLRGDLTTITLLPPLSRHLGPLTPALYPAFSMSPQLRTHLIGLLEKPSS